MSCAPLRRKLDACPQSTCKFKRAVRALDTALALGSKGIFELADFGSSRPSRATPMSATRWSDAMSPRCLRTRGEAVLATAERYLANDGSVEVTAKDLDVHSNTVRHRLVRFEEAAGRPLRDTETIGDVCWALQRRRLG